MEGDHHRPTGLGILVDAVTPSLVVEQEAVPEEEPFDFAGFDGPQAAYATVTSWIFRPWFPEIRPTFLGASK